MSIGFSYTFDLDKAILSAALQAIYRKPGLSHSDLGSAIGLNSKKTVAYSAWLLYLGLRNAKLRELSPLGELLSTKDPYIDDELSLQLLHYQLCSNSNAIVWWTLVNQVIPNIGRLSVTEVVELLKSRGIGNSNIKNLRSDVGIFFNAYQAHQIFGTLYYLRKVEKQVYIPESVDLKTLLLAYVLYHRRESSIRTSTISVRSLLLDEGQVGKIFLLDDSKLRKKLRELEFQGIVKVSRIADLDNVAYTFDGTALDILKMYYQRRG